jgi:phosphoribosylamine--glycine ligase
MGDEISGIERVKGRDGISLFHAGTAMKGGKLVTQGGRVLDVTALGRDLPEARKRAYEACGMISWRDHHYRKDIAI